MALNQLSEKLDGISENELGYEFDNNTWDKIEERLDAKKRYARWWMLAACLLFCFTFIPIRVFKQPYPINKGLPMAEVSGYESLDTGIEKPFKPIEVVPETIKQKEIGSLQAIRSIKLELAEVHDPVLDLNPVIIIREEKYKPEFSAKDISVIQASLERPSIENGRSITVRAQLESFSGQANLINKELKIKLYEKH